MSTPVAPAFVAALGAARRGMRVFPVRPGGKAPARGNWESRATCETGRLEFWFGRPGAPRYNVGIATGPSGLVVVDLDTPAHAGRAAGPGDRPAAAAAPLRDGREVFAELCDRAGVPWPSTLTVTTPSGGQHLYFRHPSDGPELRNTAARLGPSVDTRAGGGYVVGPGSVTPLGEYRITRPVPVAELPAWLRKALTPAPVTPAPPTPVLRNPSRYVDVVIDDQTRQVRQARTGTRHVTLLDAARRLGQLVGGGILDEADARQVLRVAAEGHVGIDGCTRVEVEGTITDGINYGRNRPRRPRSRLPGPTVRVTS